MTIRPLAERLDTIVMEATAPGVPPSHALMRLLTEAETEADAAAALVRAKGSCPAGSVARVRLATVTRLWRSHPQSWRLLRATMAQVDHAPRDLSPDESLRYWAAAFDRLVAASPEASVAAYSLGSPDLLAAATAEVCATLENWGLLGRDRDGLDLGCGIGRFLCALAPRLRSIVGLDLSAGMVAEALARCAGLETVRVLQTSGRDLREIADHSMDLVLASDVFPYLVEAGSGLARTHVVEIARVLRPGGRALLLNYAYGKGIAADREAMAGHAAAAGLTIERNGTREFTLWDATIFLLGHDR